MDYQAVRARLVGPIEGVPTIFDADNKPDLRAIQRVVNWLVDSGYRNGTGALLCCSAVGQFMTMTNDERKAVHEACVEAAAGRVPVIVGAQASGTDLAIDIAEHAASIGADMIQLAPPHYYFAPQIGQEDVIQFFKDIAAEADIAIVGYHNWWSSVGIDPETVARLADEVPNLVGIKWRGRNDAETYLGYRLCARKINIIENDHHFWAATVHQYGARAFVSVTGLAWPEYDLEVWRLLEANQYAEATEMLERLAIPLNAVAYKVNGEFSNLMCELLRMRGFAGWTPRRPTRPLPQWAVKEVHALFHAAGAPFMKELVA